MFPHLARIQLSEKVYDRIIDFLISDTLASGQDGTLRTYSLVNRYWALRIRPAIFRQLRINQNTAASFLYFVQSHTLQPNICECAISLHLIADISMTDGTPWFHEIMELLRVGAFRALGYYLIENYSSCTGNRKRAQTPFEYGELQVKRCLPLCPPVPHARCERVYRGHRLRTLGTFLDLIDIEDHHFILCEVRALFARRTKSTDQSLGENTRKR